MKNLAKEHKDYAVFLPAISSFYVKAIADPTKIDSDRVPKGFENGVEGLDFLDEDKGYFYYDKCLYSAGHAALDIQKSNASEPMIQGRNRDKITLVGDSGGFQIGKGVIKFDWDNFFEKKGDPGYVGKADEVRLKILRWLEHTAEWSMTLDVPTWACDVNNRGKTGLKSFDDCLAATLHNNDFFVKNRVPGATKFLNVLQGGDWMEAERWYEAVKHYPFEGWAFGGNNMRDIGMALKRIIILRDEGLLEGRDWIHFLGTSKLDWACMLTAVQRQIRKHINPNLTISFDCASPFIATANGLSYTYNMHTTDRWSYIMDSFPDNKDFKGSSIPFPFESEIGKRLTMGDICVYGNAHGRINGEITDATEEEIKLLIESGVDAKWVPADLNKIGKEGKTSWDSFSYALIMSHNVYKHIRAVQVANQLVDIEYTTYSPDIREWKRLKNKDKSGELSQWVPRNLLYFNSFVEELFVHDDPLSFIEENAAFLNDVSQRRNATGNTLHFNSLFDEPVTSSSDEDFSDMQPDQAEELEQKLMSLGE